MQVKKFAASVRKRFYCNFYLAHEMEIAEIVDDDIRQIAREYKHVLEEAKIQVSFRSTAVQFLGSNPATVDLAALNVCIQNHLNFANLPVYREVEHVKSHVNDPWKKKDNPGAVLAVILVTSSDPKIRKEVISQAKSVFNVRHNTHL